MMPLRVKTGKHMPARHCAGDGFSTYTCFSSLALYFGASLAVFLPDVLSMRPCRLYRSMSFIPLCHRFYRVVCLHISVSRDSQENGVGFLSGKRENRGLFSQGGRAYSSRLSSTVAPPGDNKIISENPANHLAKQVRSVNRRNAYSV
jgi:hypothetical protein